MLEVSEKFRELMNSNIRPKIEITITIKNGIGEGMDLVWKGKDITSMSFKRGFDPVGRTLPFLELRWSEIYLGKLNENSYPQIYENVTSLLRVELKLSQKLDFETDEQEEFVFPVMFLSAKPTVKENVVEWVAYDVLKYLDVSQTAYFDTRAYYSNVLIYILQNSVSPHIYNRYIVDYISKTVGELKIDESYSLVAPMLLDGESNSILKDVLSTISYCMDFKNDFLNFSYVAADSVLDVFTNSNFYFPLKLQYKNPTVVKNSDISDYQYKQYYIQENPDGKYEQEWSNFERYSKIDYSLGFAEVYYALLFEYIFKGYGKISEDVSFPANGDIKTAYSIIDVNDNTENPSADSYKIPVIPIELNSVENKIKNEKIGEVFIEDNKADGKSPDALETRARFSFLTRYFNKNCDSIEMECAPNIALETGDIIKIETGIENGLGERKIKDAVIVEYELQYSGSLKQKIKAHEVIL